MSKPKKQENKGKSKTSGTDQGRLTRQQREFVNFYLQPKDKGGDNITRAYKHAYPNVKNDNTAGAAGYRLLRSSKISKIVDEARMKAVNETGMTAKETLLSIANMAQGDLADYMEWKQEKKTRTKYNATTDEETTEEIEQLIIQIKDSKDLTKEQTKRIKKIKIDKDGCLTIELEPRAKYHEMLAKYHSLLTGDNQESEKQTPAMMIVNYMEKVEKEKGE